MLEIRLTPVSFAPTVAPVAAGTAAESATTVPPSLAVLPTGTILKGFVLNRDAQGNPVLRTDQGDFVMESKVFLKIGSDVTVKIDGGGRNFHASLVSVDGHSPAELPAFAMPLDEEVTDIITRSPLSQGSGNAAAANSAQRGAAIATMAQNNAPLLLNGTVLTPAPALAQGGPAPLQAGTQLLLLLVESQFPEIAGQPAAAAASPSLALPTTAQTPPGDSSGYAAYGKTLSASPAATAAVATPGTLPPQAQPQGASTANAPAVTPIRIETPAIAVAATEESLIPAATQAPVSAGTSSSPASAAAQATVASAPASTPTPSLSALRSFLQAPAGTSIALPATVIAQEISGEPLLQTALGLVRLDGTESLPTGVKMLFTAALTGASPSAQAPAAEELSTLPTSGSWANLQQLLTALSTEDAAELSAQLTARMPVLQGETTSALKAPAFGNALLFFFSAVKGGDFRQWIGEKTVEKLQQKGFGNLLKAVEGDFAKISQSFLESLSQGWQSLFVPVMDEAGVQMARLFYKRGRKPKKEGKTAQDYSRFVVEVNLSAMGEMQLDGFVQWQEESHDTRFDLIIRSHRGLSEEAQRDIIAIYHSTGELTGYQGSIQFQTAREFPVHPLEEMHSGHPPDIVV